MFRPGLGVSIPSITCLAALSIVLLMTACGGGNYPSTPPPNYGPSSIQSVTIQSTTSFVKAGQPAYFNYNVVGTGTLSVKWSVNGISGGDAVNGTIVGGKYNAPTTLPPTNPVTITVTSVVDPTKSASAMLSVFTLTVSPSSATVFYNHSQQFTATVAGVSNPVVTWQAQYGTVDQTGLYTASTTIGQNATDLLSVNLLNYNNGPPTQVPITLRYPTPVVSSITPNGASAYESVVINGQDMFGVSNVSFPGPFGAMLPADLYQPPGLTQIFVTVPIGAVSGQVVVDFSPQGVSNTASVSFTRLANLRIRAGLRDLSSGESVQFQYRLLGTSAPNAINWTVDLGNISSTGLYQAPTVSQESFATVVACLVGTNSCDSTILRILPLRVTPTMPVVGMGQSVQLDALQGSAVSANWSVLAGGGSVSSSGLFTAATNPLQGGGIPVSATAGSATATASVGVTGAFPGFVSQTYDYMNIGNNLGFNLQKLEGTLVKSMAVSGTRAYTLDFALRAGPPFFANPPFAAIEVYDISNPLNPVWLDAREPGGVPLSSFNSIGWDGSYLPLVFSTYSHYLFEVDPPFDTGTTVQAGNPVALYDIQSTPPQLVSWAYSSAQLNYAFASNGVIYGVPNDIPYVNGAPSSVIPIYVIGVTTGTIEQTQINITLPGDVLPGNLPVIVVGNGTLLYCVFGTQGQNWELATYDTSVSPPNLVGSAYFPPQIGVGAIVNGNLLFMGNLIFDISNPLPVQIGSVPVQLVEDVQGTRLLGRGFLPIYTAQDNYVLVDISNPANATIEASVYDLPDAVPLPTARFVGNGNSIVAAEGLGGIATIDLSTPGGMIDKGRYSAWDETFDVETNQQTIYIAGENNSGQGGLLIADTSTGTPTFDSILQYNQDAGLAVQISNNTAFLGLVDSLKTIDVTNPTSPTETGSLALPTSALALSGNILFDGTLDGRLVALNVTNPNNPVVLSTVSLPAQAVNLRLSGSTLLVADGAGGFLVFNVSNPSAPVQLSQISLSTPVWDIAVSGNFAFLAADFGGLVVFDVSNPAVPKQVAQQTVPSYALFPYFDSGPASLALSVKLQNGLVYVGTANDVGLIFAFDCSQPSYPRLVAMNAVGEFIDALVSGFSLSGNDVYVFGSLGADTDIVQSDNSAPRNAINVFTPPVALFDGSTFATEFASSKSRVFVHPKFDKHLLQRQHRWPLGTAWGDLDGTLKRQDCCGVV